MSESNPIADLVGHQLSAVVFVQDYVQLQFDGPIITVFTPVSVVRDSHTSTFPDAGSRDALCSVIGKTLTGQSLRNEDALILEFEGGVTLRVPLDFDSRVGPEAMNFHSPDRRVLNVW